MLGTLLVLLVAALRQVHVLELELLLVELGRMIEHSGSLSLRKAHGLGSTS